LHITSGTRIGSYEVVDSLGAGGMGNVYRASDPRLGREIAIKTLPPEFAHDLEKLFTFDDPDVKIDYPVWSPDGHWLLFDRFKPEGGDIWMAEGIE